MLLNEFFASDLFGSPPPLSEAPPPPEPPPPAPDLPKVGKRVFIKSSGLDLDTRLENWISFTHTRDRITNTESDSVSIRLWNVCDQFNTPCRSARIQQMS